MNSEDFEIHCTKDGIKRTLKRKSKGVCRKKKEDMDGKTPEKNTDCSIQCIVPYLTSLAGKKEWSLCCA